MCVHAEFTRSFCSVFTTWTATSSVDWYFQAGPLRQSEGQFGAFRPHGIQNPSCVFLIILDTHFIS